MLRRRIDRRNFMKLGAACLGGATASAGINYLTGGALHGGQPATSPGFEGVAENLGKYIYLTPQKLGGGTHAVDLQSSKTLAWISYWNYGDTCPISHHLAAFPPDSGDPYQGFEFVNSTQGGENVLMYGLRT